MQLTDENRVIYNVEPADRSIDARIVHFTLSRLLSTSLFILISVVSVECCDLYVDCKVSYRLFSLMCIPVTTSFSRILDM